MGTSILVVDDEESLRITLAANLELSGFEVVEAANGTEALQILEKRAFDVVLSDIRMPGMNGVELFQRIKQARPGMPVVLMTAFAMEGLVREAVTSGVFAVLPKPFDPAHAVTTISRAASGPAVMVVDDVQADAESMVAALRTAGVNAQAATSGQQALELFQSGGVDVCVVDLVMPGMSGPELVEKLRKLDPTVSVIAFSGHAVPEMMRQVAGAGDVACARKPIPPHELMVLIANSRARNRQARARAS
ncbi:MAG: response regulator [Deltaproteobacteria bacterium]|nr:response regulator [Deltaproteobacteria bacterium]